MFAWATTRDRAGVGRRYAVAGLIRLELDALASSDQVGAVDVGKVFIDWVDSHIDDRSIAEAGKLLEELIRQDVMSFSLYTQRMIARGETEVRQDGVSRAVSFGAKILLPC